MVSRPVQCFVDIRRVQGGDHSIARGREGEGGKGCLCSGVVRLSECTYEVNGYKGVSFSSYFSSSHINFVVFWEFFFTISSSNIFSDFIFVLRFRSPFTFSVFVLRFFVLRFSSFSVFLFFRSPFLPQTLFLVF